MRVDNMEFGFVEIVMLGLLTVAFCGLLGIVPKSINQHHGPTLEIPEPRADQGVSQSVLDDSKHTSPSPSDTATPKDQARGMRSETAESMVPQIDVVSADPALTNVPETSPHFDRNSLTHEDYTIGWMCALPIELTTAKAMLDQIHPDLPKANAADSNTYTLGSIGSHNVALAGLPNGSYGTNSAAVAASHMLSAFPNLRFGLMVGIGGGAPSEDHDIRLGDIVVSKPQGNDGGVIQIDLGKATVTGFNRTGTLNRPPTALLTALTKLEAEHFCGSEKIPVYIGRLHKKYPSKAKQFTYRLSDDNLYQAGYEHKPAERTCRNCDPKQLVCRENRDSDNPVIHYGTIASSNQVIKHGPTRDSLQKEHEALCFEMEAAGLMNDFPCVVIRGICDYADSHKNERWQPYAAAVAAAYGRELLEQIPVNAVDSTLLAKEIANLREEMTRTVTSAVTHGLRPVQDELVKRKSNEILDWLTRSNHEAKYADSINSDRYKEGTGRWFLDSSQFQGWLLNPGQTIFCPGIPGSGKTIIASLAIQNLLSSLSRHESIVTFLYCEYGRQYEQTIDGLITALLRQFSSEDDRLLDQISSLKEVCEKEKRRPKRDEVSRMLTAVAKSYDRVFIIIDALDECSEETRRELLVSVRHLQNETSINLLATSRPVPEIEELFQKYPRLEIRASEEDVELYLQSRLRDLPDWVREDETLQQKIKSDISGAIDGMFLLARLHFDSLKGTQTKGEIKEALDAFKHPQGDTNPLNIAYDGAIQRITGQTPKEKMWAQKVLSWVVLARRPLSPIELQHALGVRPGDRWLNSENFPRPANIVSLCAGLVLINQESNVVQLVHYTTKEYFENNPPEWMQSAKEDLARSCLQYLTLNAFDWGPCPHPFDFEDRTSMNPFFIYAACYWMEHSQGVEANVKDVALTFLSNWKHTGAAGEAVSKRGLSTKLDYVHPGWSGIHTVAFFGLSTLFQFLLNEQSDQQKWLEMVNSEDGRERTPLFLAVENGHKALVTMLIDSGARVNSDSPYDPLYGTPLYVAARKGCEEVVKILVDAEDRMNVHSKDPYDKPLRAAAENGHEAVVRILVDAEDRTNAQSKDRYDGPLCAAAANGHEAVAKILIDADDRANAGSKGRYGAPLCTAAENGHEAIVKMFIDLGERVDFNFTKRYKPPLSLAASNGHEAIVKMLIDLGDKVDLNLKDSWQGRAPLSCAASNGHEAIVKMLIDLGDKVDVNSRDFTGGKTPLSLAAAFGCVEVARILIDLKDRVDVDSKDDYGSTPLHHAAENGHGEIVKMLIGLGERVDVDLKNKHGSTPLHHAAKKGHGEIVKMLIGLGDRVGVDWKDNYGCTPLWEAALYGREAVVKMLLDLEDRVDVNSKNEDGWTPLYLATDEAVAKILRDKGGC